MGPYQLRYFPIRVHFQLIKNLIPHTTLFKLKCRETPATTRKLAVGCPEQSKGFLMPHWLSRLPPTHSPLQHRMNQLVLRPPFKQDTHSFVLYPPKMRTKLIQRSPEFQLRIESIVSLPTTWHLKNGIFIQKYTSNVDSIRKY